MNMQVATRTTCYRAVIPAYRVHKLTYRLTQAVWPQRAQHQGDVRVTVMTAHHYDGQGIETRGTMTRRAARKLVRRLQKNSVGEESVVDVFIFIKELAPKEDES